ncbi:alkaline phosphatase family protein [Hahella ganghwensis]|uniref:alkaline phosphatase family protein n=1 Tax=Hahella ganghwensis TaxID=286420 RepID=UPI0003783D98|nr:alkaline phosphatase family protein [Hahella ganghwensis]
MEDRVFDHVLIIMFENEYRGYVLENEYMRGLAAQGIELTNCFGVMHPSQTNYITSISGELCNVSDDDKPAPLPQKTIVDLIEASPLNLRWKAYMDSYVSDDTPWCPEGFSPRDHYPYVIKHNPFSSFKNILDNRQRWEKIDNEAGFWRDLLNNDFPEYAWFTPNMWNDGHYLVGTLNDNLNGERAPVLVDQQAKWLQSFFAGLNFPGPCSKLPPKTLVVVTYDEADFEAFYDKGKKYTYDGPNQIYTVLLGDMIKPGKQSEGYNHYSLLRTIEKNFHLGDLQKNDRDANWFQFLWGKSFQWQGPCETPLKGKQNLSAVSFRNELYVVSVDLNGTLKYCVFDGHEWSPEVPVAEDGDGYLDLAANDDMLVLAYRNSCKQLVIKQYDLETGWRTAELPDTGEVEEISLVAVPHQPKFILVYRDNGNQQVHSLTFSGGFWQGPSESICSHSDGSFTLAALGPTIMFIYKVIKTGQLSCLSYNTAEFNKVTVENSQYAGPYDDTTVNQWSASAFSLNHYSEAPNAVTPHEEEPVTEGINASGELAVATLQGSIYLVHNRHSDGGGNGQLLYETFSISGTLTPANPVSYNPAENDTTSNGYGTLAEAGWSSTGAVNGVFRNSDTPLAMATLNDTLWLFYQPLTNERIWVCPGAYLKKKE